MLGRKRSFSWHKAWLGIGAIMSPLDATEGVRARRGEQPSGWPTQRFAAIVGAPRCGTTMQARLLQAHPAVSFSRVKEPHFFSRVDLTGLAEGELRDFVREQYLDRYFAGIDPETELIAEGSVSYLYGPELLVPVLRLWPDARFVIAVRDPLELIPSLHQRLVYQGDETVRDLERAWRLIPERRAGRKVPRTCLDFRQLLYDEAARLGKHVEHFFEVVGRERCHVVVFDDLKSDPGDVHRRLLDFLGLPIVPFPALEPQRESQGFKIGWLQRLLKRPPIARTVLAGEVYRRRVSSAPAREPSPAARKVLALRKALLRWNRAPAPPLHVPPALAAEIRDLLSDDVDRLGRAIGRDLGHWLGR